MNYGGIGEDKLIRHNNFNSLNLQTRRNAFYNDLDNNTRFHLNLTRKSYDNTYNQLPNGLQLNGHKYSQSFNNPVQTIIYRDYDDAGRNVSLYNALYERPVNISGELFDNKKLKPRPLLDGSKTFSNKVLGIRK